MAVQAKVQEMPAPTAALAQTFSAAAPADYRVTDIIWLMIVGAFVVVLVGSFIALALLLFFNSGAQVQVLVTVFTTTVGFLAGLVTPSPGTHHQSGGGSGAGAATH